MVRRRVVLQDKIREEVIVDLFSDELQEGEKRRRKEQHRSSRVDSLSVGPLDPGCRMGTTCCVNLKNRQTMVI